LFPREWPTPGAGVVWLAYLREALPTGVVRYRLSRPSHRIELHAEAELPRVNELPGRGTLGSESWPNGSPDPAALMDGQQAVLDVVFGCKPLAAVSGRLRVYDDWMLAHELLAQDVALQAPAFFDWLRAHKDR
jgi:hypothetical protein